MEEKKKYNIQSKLSYGKFFIAILFFIVWVGFIDQSNYKTQLKYQSKINDLEKEKTYYLNKIKKDSARVEELNTNNENLEKFAREKFMMKKENEDLFIVVEK